MAPLKIECLAINTLPLSFVLRTPCKFFTIYQSILEINLVNLKYHFLQVHNFVKVTGQRDQQDSWKSCHPCIIHLQRSLQMCPDWRLRGTAPFNLLPLADNIHACDSQNSHPPLLLEGDCRAWISTIKKDEKAFLFNLPKSIKNAIRNWPRL